ncbi:MAG: AAA family ATPase [Rhizobiales bacterium]|nr:AAA family ATPase [Hyphomicrobiales bacterium]
MTPLLRSITVTNFRSIKGLVTVPLDAPVVLIHGQNGAGKTSILSAIELGLTSQVPSLARLDRDYISHLVHKEADEGRITATVDGLNGASRSAEIAVTRTGVSGNALLSLEQAHFYSERCYLAQATLGRLLEIYEDKDTRKSDSTLTKFVKDLLGLDHLDALIEGLHDAGDIRRLRGTLPAYWDVRETIPTLENDISTETTERARLDNEIQTVNDRLLSKLAELGVQSPSATPDTELSEIIENRQEEPELQRLARIRRDIIATRDQWRTVQSPVDTVERDNAERAVAHANASLETWRSSTGVALENLSARLNEFFSDLPSPQSAGPERARTAALQTLIAELERCVAVLARDAEDTGRLETLDQGLGRARARAAVLDEQIAGHAAQAGTLAQVLAEILPHVHSEDCPVCGRDFSETSTEPLRAHVSNRIAALTESAGRLQALTRERTDASRTVADAERQRAAIAARLLAAAARDELKSRRARLEELHRALTDIAPAASSGEQLIAAAAAASQRLSELRSYDQRAMAIRESAARFAQELGLEPVGEAEGVEAALQRFEANVSAREATLIAHQSARREALSDIRERRSLTAKRSAIANAIAEKEGRADRLRTAKEKADGRIAQARELGRRAREARTNIVRRVFNDSLNAVWRDLFVRLAPDEPFVPAFALPEGQGGPVEAALETLYRSGGKGGNPRAMLSAGNLNTAALTLFLALHLSVGPTLPWLVIDDPVQSMDEVHIAQFAALLRTLSKQHGRQVIIAVHEKPLFDYLALELSPAFQDDRLITIEMGRTASGATVVNYEPLIWKPDTAIAA